MLINSSTTLNNFNDIITSQLPYLNVGNTSGNITLKENTVTTAHFTGNHTVTLPTIVDFSKQIVCILDYTTTNAAYPSITNSNIKLEDGASIVSTATTGTSKNITGASNTTPIEITITSHGYQTGEVVLVASVGGNTAANGSWTITKTGDNTFTLNNSTGDGSYTSGGTCVNYGIRNRLTFTSNNASDSWEVKKEQYGGVEAAFSQPTLSADGTLGGDSFAVYASSVYSGYPAYRALDANSTTEWASGSASAGVYFTFYNPTALKVSNLNILNRPAGYDSQFTSYEVFGSNDNSNWASIASGSNSVYTGGLNWDIPIPEANRGFYKYYKVVFGAANGYPTFSGGITTLTITAAYIAL